MLRKRYITYHVQSTSASAIMHACSFHDCKLPPLSVLKRRSWVHPARRSSNMHWKRLVCDIRKPDVQTVSAALRISQRMTLALPRVLQVTVRSRGRNVPHHCPSANVHFDKSSATGKSRYPSAYCARLLEKSVQTVIRISRRFARFPRRAPCNRL